MSAADTYKDDFKKGFETEDRFIAECKKMNLECRKTSKQVDMKDHVDWIITKKGREYKIDIKGIKKINRYDAAEQEDYHYVEIKNVNGDDGWAYGKSDMFAFEIFNAWIIVLKKDLIKLIEDKVQDEKVDRPAMAIYKKYTREKYGKKDVITLVKTLDLVSISSNIIKKTI